MRVMHVNSSDVGGGAERVATDLVAGLCLRGHGAWIAAGRVTQPAANRLEVAPLAAEGAWRRFWGGQAAQRGAGPAPSGDFPARMLRVLARPGAALARALGREDFAHPATWRLLDLVDPRADVLHVHNAHGGYFDLRALAHLSHECPLFITLHDAWWLTGHCAHPFGCQRWMIGCGACPDLSIYPAVRRDATAFNARRKRAIYAASRLHIAAPSSWLLGMAERSMLREGAVEFRHIPNGVDLSVFRPEDQRAARARLGWPDDERVVLVASNGLKESPFRDWRTLAAAIRVLGASRATQGVRFVVLGERGPLPALDPARLTAVPYLTDPRHVACHYQAADLFVHATRADNFPSVVLEAGACALPVIASRVGGLPEQITPGENGELVPPGDVGALVAAVEALLLDTSRRREQGRKAAERVAALYGLDRMVDGYVSWYEEVVAGSAAASPAASSAVRGREGRSSGAAFRARSKASAKRR